MKYILFVIIFTLSSLFSSAQNTLQNRKDAALRNKPDDRVAVECIWCSGSGKRKATECNNCLDWNAEYRSKVACHVCRDSRKIKAYEILCEGCVNNSGVMYLSKDGLLSWNSNKDIRNSFKLLKY